MDRGKAPFYILPVIIFSQFAGTSLWFAGNAVLPELQALHHLPAGATGNLTSAVQFGFISGTLIFAVLMVADRFSPSRVFLFSSLAGALFNLGLYFVAGGFYSLVALRFLTGFCLAGIYPVGMKIAADWYARDLGKALGWLVGALVLGTAFPHFLRFQTQDLPWRVLIIATSGIAVAGGMMMGFLVSDGPHRVRGSRFSPAAIVQIFRYPDFRHAAFGYFGHMWELYAFWAFVPVFLRAYAEQRALSGLPVSFWSAIVIAAGSLGCVLGGYWSMRAGSARVAWYMLLVSCLCCLLSFLVFRGPSWLLLTFLIIWGVTVVGDSPQYSTLVARTAPKDNVGSALTLVNCIGFFITIFSIELLNLAAHFRLENKMFLLLVVGPVFGLREIRKLIAGH